MQIQQEEARAHQKEGEYDAPYKEPLSSVKRNGNTAYVLATVENFIGPTGRGQHGDGGKDIRDVDEEGFQDDDVEP